MDIRMALMTGIPIPIEECQLVISQPSIKQLSYIGETELFQAIQTLSLNKTMFVEDKTDLGDINNFQIFMKIMTDKETQDKKIEVLDLLSLTFPDYKIMLTPRSLIFNKDGEMITVDESNFEFLQAIIRKIFCTNSQEAGNRQGFNPANAKAKEIADKLMRGRQRVAEINGTANTSIFAVYLSVLSVALHIPIPYLAEKYTMYMLFDAIERYSLNINWDIDIRSRLAGAKVDSPMIDWMKNIH